MAIESASASDEAEIRTAIDDWAAALRTKDVDRLVSHYVPDAVTADLAPPLWNVGTATLRRNFEAWFSTWVDGIGLEIRDVHVTVGGDVAYARSSHRLHGPRTDGTHSDVWVRATVCFRRLHGAWRVEHEHVSVPFYMDGSVRAAIDLRP